MLRKIGESQAAEFNIFPRGDDNFTMGDQIGVLTPKFRFVF